MVNEEIPREIIQKLQDKYSTSESRQNLRLNESLIKEILDIVEESGFDIVSRSEFTTANFSATALDMFSEPIKQWAQSGIDYYIPAEQILRDLMNQGWVVQPPKGV
jgi:DUF1009 family protein